MFFLKRLLEIVYSNRKNQKPYLNCWVTFGDNAVVLTDEKGKEITIVDRKGNIQNFPGIEDEKLFINELKNGDIFPKVIYYTEFYLYEDFTWQMLWQVQPDGRCWEDFYGLEGECEDEIILYSYFDKTGKFLNKFRAYSVGAKKYFQEDKYNIVNN